MRISDWSSDVCSSDLEPSDIAKIITLRLLREAAHGHVVDQALAQRADRANLDKLVHRSTPQVKEPKGSACGSPRSIRCGDRWAALHRGSHQSAQRLVHRPVPVARKSVV